MEPDYLLPISFILDNLVTCQHYICKNKMIIFSASAKQERFIGISLMKGIGTKR